LGKLPNHAETLLNPYKLTKHYCTSLQYVLGKFIQGFLFKPYKLYVYFKPYSLHLALSILKASSLFLLDSLLDLVALDFPSNKQNRFLLHYVFWITKSSFRFIISIAVSSFKPVLSISTFFSSADWLERELWDMYGIKFLLHKDLRRILTDYGFQGHPFKKDFPLVGFVEVRYDELSKAVLLEPVELQQEFRYFFFANPWREWSSSNVDFRWDFKDLKDY
jgi:NADH:ubiquinone oxidoreductase subunit C